MPTMIRDTDLELLSHIHELRFCTIDHLMMLTGRHRQALNLRLQRLIAEKYVYRIKFDNPNHKHIYSLGSQGFRHLAFHGVIGLGDVPVRLRTAELKPMFLDHTLMVAEIHTALILASRDGSVQLTDWREGKELYESVTFYEDGKKKRLPVCPDAFFQIQKGNSRFAYALEADRGTTTRRTFDDKINAYWRFLEQDRQIKAYGVSWFRVLTVTLTEARAKGLTDLATQSVPPRFKKYFPFVPIAAISGKNGHYIFESLKV
ncbi:MAG: replication-relaxation family protein [Pyrinomonadaceae bacterium]